MEFPPGQGRVPMGKAAETTPRYDVGVNYQTRLKKLQTDYGHPLQSQGMGGYRFAQLQRSRRCGEPTRRTRLPCCCKYPIGSRRSGYKTKLNRTAVIEQARGGFEKRGKFFFFFWHKEIFSKEPHQKGGWRIISTAHERRQGWRSVYYSQHSHILWSEG